MVVVARADGLCQALDRVRISLFRSRGHVLPAALNYQKHDQQPGAYGKDRLSVHNL